MTKKRSSDFGEGKCTLADKILATPMSGPDHESVARSGLRSQMTPKFNGDFPVQSNASSAIGDTKNKILSIHSLKELVTYVCVSVQSAPSAATQDAVAAILRLIVQPEEQQELISTLTTT